MKKKFKDTKIEDKPNLNNPNSKYSKQSKEFELDFNFNCNLIEKFYTEDYTKFIIQLQAPPVYKTNFLKLNKEEKNMEYEYTICPFKNFKNEISNLKLRNFFILIEEKNIKIDINNSTIIPDNPTSSLAEIFENLDIKIEIDESIKYSNIITEKKFKAENGIICELNEYFENQCYIDALKSFGFLTEDLSSLEYCILVIVSENILSYFNALEFVQKLENSRYFHNLILYTNHNLNTSEYSGDFYDNFDENENVEKKKIFENYSNKKNFRPEFFIETLIKIISLKKNSFCDLDLDTFENIFRENFKLILLNFFSTTDTNIPICTKATNFLIRSQRVLVTPTYTAFAPYTEDQGNRILREFLNNPMDGLRLIFKMDNFEDARFNNVLLVEYIKFYLINGIKIHEKKFDFYNYSQSQFRTMGCWLIKNAEEILEKCGNFKSIKTVSKYGARIGQTLTSTLKTIQINSDYTYYSEDVSKFSDDPMKKKLYDFSDGVGTITFDLAEKIARKLDLDEVPAAFQARFLGAKGVWTVLYAETLQDLKRTNDSAISKHLTSHGIKFKKQILIRDSQKKFDTFENSPQTRFFEVCNYAKFIKCYLNRQIILLLSSLGIKDEIFLKKLNNFNNSLAKEDFVISLITYEHWNSMLFRMLNSGINQSNDRLMRFVVSSNKDILYKELKKRTRIFIEEGAYVIGIMDEFGILDYGEAFLRVKNEKYNLILDKKCAVTKCPCLHPGDVRLLDFKKNLNTIDTKKYKVFERYENVLIFPGRGVRPHPNEISGSDLDGDEYFVFFDQDLCKIKTIPPMDYTDNTKAKEKENINRMDVIEFFAEYSINSNLGLIADAHMAIADKYGALDDRAKRLAKKFALAVDAPKTGADVKLDDDECEDEYPHFMGDKKKTYRSSNILGKLHDKILEYIEKLDKDKNFMRENKKFYDENFILEGNEKFYFEGLINYMEYLRKFVDILKLNEIPNESCLLSGNNPDGFSAFDKKKHNYDIIEKLKLQLKEIYEYFKEKFEKFSDFILDKNSFEKDTDFFKENNFYEMNVKNGIKNNINLRASAYYYVAYNFRFFFEKIRSDVNFLDDCFEKYASVLVEENYMGKDSFSSEFTDEDDEVNFHKEHYNNYSLDRLEYENLIKMKKISDKQKIIQKLNMLKTSVYEFIKVECGNYTIPKNPNEENQYTILSFPWSCAGNYLSEIRYINVLYNNELTAV